MNYLIHLIFMFCIMSLLTISLDLFVGHLGILSLAHSVFWAAGAYGTGMCLLHLGWPFPMALLAGILLSIVLSQTIAISAYRLRHDAIILATLSLLMISLDLLKNLRSLTGGLDGLIGIPAPSWGGLAISNPLLQTVQAAAFLIVAVFLRNRIIYSPLGRGMHAFRDDPLSAVGLGVRPIRVFPYAAALSAALAAVAGALYATNASYLNPTTFNQDQAILLLVMVLIGGAGSKYGPLLGALILILLPEAFRMIGISSAQVGAIQQIFIGLCLITFAGFRPRGLWGGYRFK